MQASAANNSEEKRIFLFGHSFVSRLSREARRRQRSVLDLVGLPEGCRLSVQGHPGLTYDRIFTNLGFYLRILKREPIGTLVVDMGTNDLCDVRITPSVLVSKVLRFLDLLRTQGVQFQSVVFLTIIERSRVSRPGQVDVSTFNRQARRFNAAIANRLQDVEGAYCHCQHRISRKQHLSDGIHLDRDGMDKYCRGLKEAILRYLNC